MGVFREFLAKYDRVIVACLVGLLLVFVAGSAFMYGKTSVCKKSGGVLAVIPGVGERCVLNFIDARDCGSIFSGGDLIIPARFCRDATGLYPLGVRP